MTEGDPAQFSASATGFDSVQWFRITKGVLSQIPATHTMPNESGTDTQYTLSGATVSQDDGAQFYAQFTDALCEGNCPMATTSTATLRVRPPCSLSPLSPVSPQNPVSVGVQPSCSGGPGPLTISQGPPGSAPRGYRFLGQEADITVPPASPGAPIRIVFAVDQSLLGGADPGRVQIFRDGVPIRECPGSSTATGDPPSFACISGRAASGGTLTITVLTAQASQWDVALAPPFGGAPAVSHLAGPSTPSPSAGSVSTGGTPASPPAASVSGAAAATPPPALPAPPHAKRSTSPGSSFLGIFSGQPKRSQVVSSVAPPGALDFTPSHLAGNFSLALLLVLLSWFPAELINAVLREHHGRIAKQLGRHEQLLRRYDELIHAGPTHLMFVVFVLLSAVVYGFLDDRFGFNATSFVLVAGIAAGLAVITLAHELIRGWYVERRHRVRWQLRTLPIGIALAVVLVAISRIANFQPGYACGLVCGVVFKGQLDERDDGRSLAVAMLATLAIATGAWLAWVPIRDAALHAHPSSQVLFLDAMLAFVWIFAIQTVMFGLIPLRYLDGERIRAWSRRGWLALYVLGMFVFVEALVHPGHNYGGSSGGTLLSMLIIFLVFSAAAVAFWGWFRFEHWRAKGTREETKVG